MTFIKDFPKCSDNIPTPWQRHETINFWVKKDILWRNEKWFLFIRQFSFPFSKTSSSSSSFVLALTPEDKLLTFYSWDSKKMFSIFSFYSCICVAESVGGYGSSLKSVSYHLETFLPSKRSFSLNYSSLWVLISNYKTTDLSRCLSITLWKNFFVVTAFPEMGIKLKPKDDIPFLPFA